MFCSVGCEKDVVRGLYWRACSPLKLLHGDLDFSPLWKREPAVLLEMIFFGISQVSLLSAYQLLENTIEHSFSFVSWRIRSLGTTYCFLLDFLDINPEILHPRINFILNARTDNWNIDFSDNLYIAIYTSQAIHLITIIDMHGCEAIKTTLCPLNSPNQLRLTHVTVIWAFLFFTISLNFYDRTS